MGRLGYRINEPLTIPQEGPTVFDDLLGFHQTELGYTTSDLSRLLHMLAEELEAEYTVRTGHPERHRLRALPGGLQSLPSGQVRKES